MRLAAERCLGLLVEQEHPPAGVGQLGRGDQAREPAAHHDHIGVHPAIVSDREAQASSVSTRSISLASSTSLPVMPPAECVLQRKVTVRQRMSMSGW